MRYEEPSNPGREELDAALAGEDPEAIVGALLGLVAHDPDGLWLQDTCLRLLNHDQAAVRANAITALGHVARIHGALDKPRVVEALSAAARSDPGVSGRVEDALDDIATFA